MAIMTNCEALPSERCCPHSTHGSNHRIESNRIESNESSHCFRDRGMTPITVTCGAARCSLCGQPSPYLVPVASIIVCAWSTDRYSSDVLSAIGTIQRCTRNASVQPCPGGKCSDGGSSASHGNEAHKALGSGATKCSLCDKGRLANLVVYAYLAREACCVWRRAAMRRVQRR